MRISFRIAQNSDAEVIQRIFNNPAIIQWLGGFTILDSVKTRILDRQKPNVWVAEFGGMVVGAHITAGRPRPHILNIGNAGVLPEYRGNHIAKGLYLTAIMQGILEGRRLFEILIAQNNPYQFNILPKLGFNQAGELRHRTGSGLSICPFQLSLLDPGALDKMFDHIPQGVSFELVNGAYAKSSWDANMKVLKRHIPAFIPVLENYREQIYKTDGVRVLEEK